MCHIDSATDIPIDEVIGYTQYLSTGVEHSNSKGATAKNEGITEKVPTYQRHHLGKRNKTIQIWIDIT